VKAGERGEGGKVIQEDNGVVLTAVDIL